MIGIAAITALLLMAIIKIVVGEDVTFGTAFLTSLASKVAAFLVFIGILVVLKPESFPLIVAINVIVNFIATACAVQFLCSTDAKRVLIVAAVDTCVCFVMEVGATALKSAVA